LKNKIKTIIVEDKLKSSNYLKNLLESSFPEIIILDISPTITEALKSIEKHKPELVFLDIQLKDGLSFEILDKIDYQNFEVVFTTGYDNYYQKAFEYCAFNYLLKPIDLEQLTRVIFKYQKQTKRNHFLEKKEKLNAYLDHENPRIMVNIGDSHLFISVKDIIVCKADGSYTNITIKNKTYLTTKPLKYYQELLEDKKFFKASRSILVNTAHITSVYKRENLVLSNDEKIQVSTRNKYLLTDFIKLFS